MCRDLNFEDAQNRFQDVDTDQDGLVSWDEHLKETWGMANDPNVLSSEEYKDEIVVGDIFVIDDKFRDAFCLSLCLDR